jgi:membrane-associated phospholipid phosphatase
VYLSSFAFLSENRRRAFGIFFCWSTLIALSTLTTKQHYLADIVSGLTLAVPVFYWFHYLQPYRNLYGERSAPLAVES